MQTLIFKHFLHHRDLFIDRWIPHFCNMQQGAGQTVGPNLYLLVSGCRKKTTLTQCHGHMYIYNIVHVDDRNVLLVKHYTIYICIFSFYVHIYIYIYNGWTHMPALKFFSGFPYFQFMFHAPWPTQVENPQRLVYPLLLEALFEVWVWVCCVWFQLHQW